MITRLRPFQSLATSRNLPTLTLPITIPIQNQTRNFHSTSPPEPPSRQCPSCSRPIPLPLSPCPSCSTLLPLPSNLSHHSMLYLSSPISPSSSPSGPFDLPRELGHLPAHGYGLDKSDLRSKWVRRQRELHPDKFTSKGDKIVDLARELSGRVNEAYNVLGDELKRAEYILSLHDKATDETDKLDDPMMLAEILEAREELEEANNQEEIQRIRSDNHAKVEVIIMQLHSAFSEDPPNLEEAKNLAVQLRYWKGLENAAREKAI
ncbi:Fe-S protein assembly co-chaperone HscB [Kwoniella bestiolae CBS 10118]|uniref:Fe-S protein assembly co-chaperone HscB n=1 Tax=Kwoniella bestiolae CBS 10118 TaxID=1296100 RepID=A0A1B9FWD7_9TREE|nr:Fe-S protein assembly co-chaperone HscB [Kwoniella bestiolae CBS 10118]OCF23085.1 Fe-S protein assembly co-chaperone HscB [Kwoniella bestiolae CBS 10118]